MLLHSNSGDVLDSNPFKSVVLNSKVAKSTSQETKGPPSGGAQAAPQLKVEGTNAESLQSNDVTSDMKSLDFLQLCKQGGQTGYDSDETKESIDIGKTSKFSQASCLHTGLQTDPCRIELPCAQVTSAAPTTPPGFVATL